MWIILLILNLFGVRGAHDFHVSRTMMDYNEESKRLELTLYVFIDDLEIALKESELGDELQIGTRNESLEADTAIYTYITEHVNISQQSNIHLNWVGKEMSEDMYALWIYLESEPLDAPLPLKITHTLLMDIYDDQQNILKYVGPSFSKHYLFYHTQINTQFAQ